MTAKRGSWKLERASVHHPGEKRARSNKYTKHDSHKRPAPHTRAKIWVGGYTRRDGRHVEGHFRLVHSKMPASTDAGAI